jgi:hypothetical protein
MEWQTWCFTKACWSGSCSLSVTGSRYCATAAAATHGIGADSHTCNNSTTLSKVAESPAADSPRPAADSPRPAADSPRPVKPPHLTAHSHCCNNRTRAVLYYTVSTETASWHSRSSGRWHCTVDSQYVCTVPSHRYPSGAAASLWTVHR